MKLFCCLVIYLLNYLVFANVLITFAGDLNASAIPIDKKNSNKVFQSVHTILKNDDLTIANIECPISSRGKAMENKQFTFCAKPAIAKILHDNGIDAVSVANNHSLDFGRDAFIDTLNNLKSNKIISAGGGINKTKNVAPLMKFNDTNVIFFAASRVIPNSSWNATKDHPGLLTAYCPEKLITDIKTARKNKDYFIIAYLHWGEEKADKPNKIQQKLAHQLIDAGADIVIGTHPHVIQGFEWYKGKLISYSMGNFIFSCSTRPSMMIQLNIDKNKIIETKVIPLLLANKIPTLIKKEMPKQQVYKHLTELSINAIVDNEGNITRKKLNQNK